MYVRMVRYIIVYESYHIVYLVKTQKTKNDKQRRWQTECRKQTKNEAMKERVDLKNILITYGTPYFSFVRKERDRRRSVADSTAREAGKSFFS